MSAVRFEHNENVRGVDVSHAIAPQLTEPRATRPTLPALTGLRFLAALTVLIEHASRHLFKFQGATTGLRYWLLTTGAFGMSLFFVLSGFVIHYNYRQVVTGQGPAGLAAFLWARFSRLYPLYFFMLALDVLLGKTLFLSLLGKEDGFHDLARALPYFLLLLQSWRYVPFGDTSLVYVIGVGVNWSISTEWFFYLVYPLLAVLVLKIRRPLTMICVLAAWCVFWGGLSSILAGQTATIDDWGVSHYGSVAGLATGEQDSFYRWLLYFSPYSRVGEFVLGCLVAQFYLILQRTPSTKREERLGGVVMTLAFLSIFAILYVTYSTVHQSSFWFSLRYCFGLAPSAAIIIFCASRYDSPLFRWLSARSVVAMGEASYSIYLLHAVVLVVVSSYLGWSFPETFFAILFLAARFALVILMIVLFSLGLHEFLEVPSRRWLRGLWRTPLSRRFGAVPILAAPFLLAIAIAAAGELVPPRSTERIHVLTATYGGSCGAPAGNATREIVANCEGNTFCVYQIDAGVIGDPKNGCAKDFTAEFECRTGQRLTAWVPPEAGLGSLLRLNCPTPAQ
jgi:peptidoglycan/LPS O-acetylase OafA/YrhL